ncbi:MAG: AIR carboxylase family protein, partial [Oscillospiraceae bacterium]
VQMPPGMPVATVAIAGAKNAAVLAAQMLAIDDKEVAERLALERADTASAIAQADAELQHEIEAL